MPPIKHIVFPFDFSEPCIRMAPMVRTVAEKFGAKVTLLSVNPTLWTVPPAGTGVTSTNVAALEAELKHNLDAAFQKEFAGIEVERVVLSGDPAIRITSFSETKTAGLVMMPTHGFGVFRGLLIGSVTSKVLHDVKSPVWTAVHHPEHETSADLPRSILCAVDSTEESKALIRWACEFACKIGASLKLLHVVPVISDWMALPGERELQESVRDEGYKQMKALLDSAGLNVPLRVAVGKISETVTEEARRERADLIVIGRGSLASPLGRLRTHAYAIIQSSPCPVLSV